MVLNTTTTIHIHYMQYIQKCGIAYYYMFTSESHTFTFVCAVPDYQRISLSYYTHTIVWDVAAGTAKVSVYMNVTSHWTSLAVLTGFVGSLVVSRSTSYSLILVVVGLSVVLVFMCTLHLI